MPSAQEQRVGMRRSSPAGRMRSSTSGTAGSKALAARMARGSTWNRAATSESLRSA